MFMLIKTVLGLGMVAHSSKEFEIERLRQEEFECNLSYTARSYHTKQKP